MLHAIPAAWSAATLAVLMEKGYHNPRNYV